MATTRFKGETAGERLDYTSISDADMVQVRHKPGTIEDADKGISKSQLQSCPFGVCDTSAGTAAKAASLTDSNPDFTLVSGREVVVCFTTANTASNPTLNFAGSGAIPLYMPNGAPVGAWNAGAWMHLKYFYATVGNSQIQRWILMSQEVDSEVIMASSTAITGKSLVSGASIKIMFTSDITGSNTSTVLSLTYNGTAYNVKVGKNGALANFVASEVSSGTYKYVQAYTTLELAFDGTQFIIIGNPVVLSSADYTIYADGKKIINSIEINNMNAITSNAVYNGLLAKLDDDIIHSNIYSTAFKILASCYANNVSTWGAQIFNENGRHMYLVAAQRITTNKTFLSIVSTDGNKNDKTILDSIIVNTESQFSVATNNHGTYELKYADPSNVYNYNIFVMKLA